MVFTIESLGCQSLQSKLKCSGYFMITIGLLGTVSAFYMYWGIWGHFFLNLAWLSSYIALGIALDQVVRKEHVWGCRMWTNVSYGLAIICVLIAPWFVALNSRTSEGEVENVTLLAIFYSCLIINTIKSSYLVIRFTSDIESLGVNRVIINPNQI